MLESQAYERGGIVYKLTVSEREGCFHVRWKCPACGATGEVKGGHDSTSEALGRAQAHVWVDHHIPVHVLNRNLSEK
jgi:hypothetical protein